MASSLFPPMRNNPLSRFNDIRQAMSAIRSGNADKLAEQMARNNPQFAAFMRQNKGKTAEQIMNEAGINAEDVKGIMSMLK